MKTFPAIETTPTIDTLIASGAPIAGGLSGGKDSSLMAWWLKKYLEEVGYTGKYIFVHADLGRIEHTDSLPSCQRIADLLGVELVVVRREKGDMVDRWLQRWNDNVERYCNLKCVKLILPWSTANMRFCTSEMKTAIICRYLVERFKSSFILSATGIRRQESPKRAKAEVCSVQSKLEHKTFGTSGYNWNPILPWTLENVLEYHRVQNIPLHEAYTTFNLSRVSCSYCILSSHADLIASAIDVRNHDVYRELVDIEIDTAFSFQSDTWLGDVAPHLLSTEQQHGLTRAKRTAAQRERIERVIPPHLEYVRGWPTVMPTRHEAVILSEVRNAIADLYGLSISCADPDAILERYAELMAQKAKKGIVIKPSRILPVQQGLWEVAR
jgi:3'-phosphoadenosine 5'-phosphosulfate sulfotransferase (PAPS reductase)/FAD synthetase